RLTRALSAPHGLDDGRGPPQAQPVRRAPRATGGLCPSSRPPEALRTARGGLDRSAWLSAHRHRRRATLPPSVGPRPDHPAATSKGPDDSELGPLLRRPRLG